MWRFTNKDPTGFAGQQGNQYLYVDGELINGWDPQGLLTLGTGRYIGVCIFYIYVTSAVTFVTDFRAMDINIAGSFAGTSQQFSVALGGGVEITNAESIDELHGFEAHFGGSAGQVVSFSVNGIAATTYQGMSFGFSLGQSVSPAEGHAGATAGVNVFSRLLCDIRSSDDCRK